MKANSLRWKIKYSRYNPLNIKYLIRNKGLNQKIRGLWYIKYNVIIFIQYLRYLKKCK